MRSSQDERYSLSGVNFDACYNRNEKRIIRILKDVILEEHLVLTPKDIQDIYALALNSVPAHYVHRGTIVLRANVSKEYIRGIIKQCLEQVQKVAKP